MSSSALYIQNGDTTGSINSAATAGWVQLMRGPSSIGFQVVLAATGAPIGLFVFEISDDEDPRIATGAPTLGPTALTLTAAMSPGQPSDGLARNFQFDFNPAPSAKWMRMRYARTSGGSAAAGSLNVGVAQRGL